MQPGRIKRVNEERAELARQRESLKSRKRSVRSINKSRDTCGGIYDLKARGTLLIESPGYPNSYKHNQTCTFLIKVRLGNLFSIAFFNDYLKDLFLFQRRQKI